MAPDGITVRAMLPSDIPALMSILGDSPEAAQWSAESLLEMSISGTVVIAESMGRPVGFFIGRSVADEFEILNLAVERLSRRSGVATKLVSALLENCRASGTDRVFLEVRESNRAAIALYVQFGFQSTGRRARYYRDPLEDAILLVWKKNSGA